jgi:pyoverdine/dityrosine biosynthesis protein Dit1
MQMVSEKIDNQDSTELVISRVLLVLDHMRRKGNDQNWSDSAQSQIALQINGFYQRREPLKFLLPAFPFKSTNKTEKVIGFLPDEAEQVSLQNLDNQMTLLANIYPYGAEMHVFIDGFLFADFLGVPDLDAEKYVTALKKMFTSRIKEISVFDFFPEERGYEAVRKKFFENFCMTSEEIRNIAADNEEIIMRYQRALPFMKQELADRNKCKDPAEMKKLAEDAAWEVVRRDMGLGKLINSKYAHFIRCTRHTQDANSAKIGLNFLPGRHQADAPWHSVLVKMADGTYDFIKKRDAEEKGYIFIPSLHSDGGFFIQLTDKGDK